MTLPDETWQELLNSDWHDHLGSGRREDRIDRADWLQAFLKKLSTDLSGVPEAQVKAGLRALRRVLQRHVARITARGRADGRALDDLNRVLGRAPLTRRLAMRRGTPRIEMVPRARPLDAAIGEIAGAFAAVLAEGDLARIKICSNPDCLWVFYDRSKNRSRRWCEDATCGNLMKVRRFRRRSTAVGGPPA
ncbi:MAG: CGNR zinc finger domain-containing protein [Acidobacteriota bacterium]